MKPRILLIDDDIDFHENIKIAFGKRYKFISVYNETDALHVIGNKQFDLVLLDLALNKDETDGLRLIDYMQKVKIQAKIIVVTGNNEIEIIKKCIRKGAFDHLHKGSYSPIEWRYKIEDIIDLLTDKEEKETSYLCNRIEAIKEGITKGNIEHDLTELRKLCIQINIFEHFRNDIILLHALHSQTKKSFRLNLITIDHKNKEYQSTRAAILDFCDEMLTILINQ